MNTDDDTAVPMEPWRVATPIVQMQNEDGCSYDDSEEEFYNHDDEMEIDGLNTAKGTDERNEKFNTGNVQFLPLLENTCQLVNFVLLLGIYRLKSF